MIKKNVVLGTGAKILGKIEIGENSVIGANALVVTDVDSGVWCGIPATKKHNGEVKCKSDD